MTKSNLIDFLLKNENYTDKEKLTTINMISEFDSGAIPKAFDSYNDLLEACKAIRDYFDMFKGVYTTRTSALMIKVLAAIEKAEDKHENI